MKEPTIGSVVTITTQWNDYLAGYHSSVERIKKITGVRVKSSGYDNPDTWRFSTKEPFPRDAVISIARIIDIEYITGKEGKKVEIASKDFKTWTVKGSKNNVYTVTREDGKYTCSCVGFGFRKQCKHVGQCK